MKFLESLKSELGDKLNNSNLFIKLAFINSALSFAADIVDVVFQYQETNDFMKKEVESIKGSLLVLQNEAQNIVFNKLKELPADVVASMMCEGLKNGDKTND